MNGPDVFTLIFEGVVTLAMCSLVPWAARVSRELGEIKSTLVERKRQEQEIASLGKRVGLVEVQLAKVDRN